MTELGIALEGHPTTTTSLSKWMNTRLLEGDEIEVWRGEQAPFANVDRILASQLTDNDLTAQVAGWLDHHIIRSGSASQLCSDSPVDFDDPRVREYTLDETMKNRAWMALGVETKNLKTLLQVSESSSPQKGALTSSVAPESMLPAFQALEEPSYPRPASSNLKARRGNDWVSTACKGCQRQASCVH